MYKGYCMHCKEKRTIMDRHVHKTKQNKYMMKGGCEKCGGKICHMITKAIYDQEIVLSNST